MPKVLPEREGKESDYYDRKTGRTCVVVKAVDITDACPKRPSNEAVQIEYLRDSSGLQVVIRACYPDVDYGMYSIFPVEGLDPHGDPKGVAGTFKRFAEDFGLSFEQLLNVIRAHAPESPETPVIGEIPATRFL